MTNTTFYIANEPPITRSIAGIILFCRQKYMKLDGKSIQAAITQLVEDYKFDPYEVFEVIKLGIRT